jgi:hypothetical protein
MLTGCADAEASSTDADTDRLKMATAADADTAGALQVINGEYEDPLALRKWRLLLMPTDMTSPHYRRITRTMLDGQLSVQEPRRR